MKEILSSIPAEKFLEITVITNNHAFSPFITIPSIYYPLLFVGCEETARFGPVSVHGEEREHLRNWDNVELCFANP